MLAFRVLRCKNSDRFLVQGAPTEFFGCLIKCLIQNKMNRLRRVVVKPP
jgi:hypothetical protein